ncbi:MAG TPA: RimK family alpha-L-glutamate ligase [Methylophilaceae bacterium]|jgi:glutathione synthase/RimK-type ligase-like ATP-grasp enzyme
MTTTLNPSNQQKTILGLATLLRMALSGQPLAPLSAELIARAENDPGDAEAMLDLSTILQINQQSDLAMRVQADALQLQQIYHLPARQHVTLKLLVIMAAGPLMANTPIECLLENSDIAVDLLYIFPPELPLPDELPEHDLVFIAIAESDANQLLLEELRKVKWTRPIVNKPELIASLSRDNTYLQLEEIPNLLVPQTNRIGREALEQSLDVSDEQSIASLLESGVGSIIIRPVDSHAGRDLSKLDSAEDMIDYLRRTPDLDFYVSYFVDFRSEEGNYKKYRIVLIDGTPYLCHMAISDHWMIHYLNAGMGESSQKREEEAAMMELFDKDFAARHADALKAIHERIGLDYLGIDCSETYDGELLIFEIDSNMVVHDMDSVELYPYKQPQMHKIFAAFQQMLHNKAASSSVE